MLGIILTPARVTFLMVGVILFSIYEFDTIKYV